MHPPTSNMVEQRHSTLRMFNTDIVVTHDYTNDLMMWYSDHWGFDTYILKKATKYVLIYIGLPTSTKMDKIAI